MRSSSQRSASLLNEPRNEPDVRREALPRAGQADPPVRAGKGRRQEAALSLPPARAPRLLVPGLEVATFSNTWPSSLGAFFKVF